MKRRIVFYESYFIEFYRHVDENVKVKIQFVFELIQQVEKIPERFLKHVTNTKGLYEIRVEVKSQIFRIFCCFDEGRIVVLFNGYQKKTQKASKLE